MDEDDSKCKNICSFFRKNTRGEKNEQKIGKIIYTQQNNNNKTQGMLEGIYRKILRDNFTLPFRAST